MIRVLLVDDHPVVREGLKSVFARTCDIRVVAEAGDGKTALEAIRQDACDVVMLDLQLPDGPGLEVLKRIREERPDLAVLVLSFREEELYAGRVIQAGASGYLQKGQDPECILEAVRAAARGQILIPGSQRHAVFPQGQHHVNPQPLDGLSDRELEVLEALADGSSTSLISQTLGISPQAVSTYKARMVEKLSLRDAGALVHLFDEVRTERTRRDLSS